MTVIIRNSSDLARAKGRLDILNKAWEKAVYAKSYSLGTNALTLERQDLKDIEAEIQDYESAIDNYEKYGSSKRRAKRVVPI